MRHCVTAVAGVQCYQEYEEAGTDLAQALGKKEAIAKLKKAMPPHISKALGKLSSGLYVVTAAGRADARSAMIASWVAQASFEPLGLTIAIAKDRAIESLMQVRRRVCACMLAMRVGVKCVTATDARAVSEMA